MITEKSISLTYSSRIWRKLGLGISCERKKQRRQSQLEKGKPLGYGVKFVDLTAHERREIEKLIHPINSLERGPDLQRFTR